MNMLIVGTDIACISVALVILCALLSSKERSKERNICFIWGTASLVVFSFFDAIAFVMDEFGGNYSLHFWSNLFSYIGADVLAVAFAYYISGRIREKTPFSKSYSRVVLGEGIFDILASTIGAFTGTLYRIENEQTVYGFLNNYLVFIQYGVLAYFIVMVIVHRKTIERRIIITIGLYFVPPLLSMIVVLFDERITLTYLAGTISYLIVYVVVVREDLNESILNEQIMFNANKAKSDFLANMSHEIRTPINAVLGMDIMILRKSKDQEILKYANDIQSAGKNLLSIINDILDFSKIESGKMELLPVDYDLASLINDVYNMINTKAEDKGLLFETDIDSELPCRFYGDDVRIRQILVNLLTNAVKYTHNGKVTLIIKKNTTNDGSDCCAVRYEVHDTGIGIKPEDINKLTEEFVRIEESRNRNIEGTGLGINIVVSLLNLMGSKLEVSSVYGEGSVFSFTINQKVTNPEIIGDIAERINSVGDSGDDYKVSFCIPNAKILVVDDNSMNLTVFSSLLSDMLCRIDEADSGKKCLELVKENKYDIIFLDHMMPEMDGVETFHTMKGFGNYINKETPVIILTANAISGAKEDYLAEGFNDYLSKPIELKALDAILKKYLPEEYFEECESTESDTEKEECSVSDETLNALEGIIDLKLGYSYAGNKKKSYDTIIKSYINKSKDRIPYIEKVFAEKDWSSYVIEVHALKSTSLTIGAVELSELAKELELSGKSGDVDIIIDKNEVLLTLYRDAVEAASIYVKNEIKDDGAKELIDLNRDELLDVLNKIVDAAEGFDSDTVLELIADKKCSKYNGDSLYDFFSTIEDAVNDFNYDMVLENIEKFRTEYELEE